MRSKCVAFVDDEIQILRALRRLFHQTEYECYFFNSADECLEYLEFGHIDLLITDIRMPGIDGIELMKRVKEIRPQIIRIALSGYTDSRQILAALESGLAKLYIYKPWDNEEILKMVSGLLEMEESLNDNKLLETINSLNSLPTLPNLYQKINQMVENDEGANKISIEIETDPAIASKLLRIVNTAYYGSHTGSVQQAIMMLGMINVKQIILTNAVFGHAKLVPHGEIIWEQAALTNKIVHYFYETLHNKHMPLHQSTTGLMHSIGIIFMSSILTEAYRKIVEHCTRHPEILFTDAETEIADITHMQLGSYLLNWWEMPYNIVEACYFYRDPLNGAVVEKEIVSLVHVASHCAWQCFDVSLFQFELNKEVCAQYKITEDMIQHAIHTIGQKKCLGH